MGTGDMGTHSLSDARLEVAAGVASWPAAASSPLSAAAGGAAVLRARCGLEMAPRGRGTAKVLPLLRDMGEPRRVQGRSTAPANGICRACFRKLPGEGGGTTRSWGAPCPMEEGLLQMSWDRQQESHRAARGRNGDGTAMGAVGLPKPRVGRGNVCPAHSAVPARLREGMENLLSRGCRLLLSLSLAGRTRGDHRLLPGCARMPLDHPPACAFV